MPLECKRCRQGFKQWSDDREWDLCLPCTSHLARLGMVALVDESTGYQSEREPDALRRMEREHQEALELSVPDYPKD